MIALACDHGGFFLLQEIKAYLEASGYEYKDFGTYSEESCDYPIYAIAASEAVAKGECSRGILVCGTGIGMAITANKISGIRAAPCTDSYTAEMTRRHNDLNMLTLGARVVGSGLALNIVDIFLNTDFEGDRHSRRINMISELEEKRG